MTVTRVPACTVKGCPAPRDPDWHKPWCSTIEGHGCFGDATHQHWPKRSQGGKEIVACLCAGAHDRIDNGDWGNAVFETVEDGKRIRIYRAWDLHNKTLIEQTIGIVEAGNAAAESDESASGKNEHAMTDSRTQRADKSRSLVSGVESDLSAAASPASGKKEEGDGFQPADVRSGSDVDRMGARGTGGKPMVPPRNTITRPDDSGVYHALDIASGESSAAEPPVRGALPGPAGDSRLVPSPTAAPPSVFDLSSWRGQGLKLAQMGLVLKESTSAWQFLVGDWFLEGEQFLGDEVYGHIEELGFPGNTLRQYSWVAATVAPDTRVLELPWSFHRAVAALPAPKQKEWLDKARDENLTTRQLHQAIHGKKPKVKRWTLEELRELAKEHWELVKSGPNAREAEGGEQFLDWLEAK